VELELRTAWDAAGRGSEIDARVQREAASRRVALDAGGPLDRDRGAPRDAGDRDGAVRALPRPASSIPADGPLERPRAGGRGGRRRRGAVAALVEIVTRVGDDGEGRLQAARARARAPRDLDSAVAAWGRVLVLDGEDEEADHSSSRSSWRATVRRAGRSPGPTSRAVEPPLGHSRDAPRRASPRAAILEQRLGRVRDACDELALLLGEWPTTRGRCATWPISSTVRGRSPDPRRSGGARPPWRTIPGA